MKEIIYNKLGKLENTILEYCNIEVTKPEDKNAPIFNYVGQTEFIVKIGDSFKIPEITAIDNVDGEVEVTRVIKCNGVEVNSINTNVKNTYYITYTAKDSSNNINELILTIYVKDMVKPVFDYTGPTTVEVEYGSNYIIPKVTANDAVDGKIDVLVTIKYVNDNSNEQSIDTNKVGTHIIKYTATDSSDNVATLEIRVTVKENIGKWETMAPMRIARYDLTASTLNGKIYAIGGYAGYDKYNYNANEMYNDKTNIWTTKKEIPHDVCRHTASTVNGKIYTIGGYNVFDYHLNTNSMYDDISNIWSSKKQMPTKRHELTSATLNNKIYVIGGRDNGAVFNKNEMYDANTDTWSTKKEMLSTRYDLTASNLNGKIYAIGGFNGPSVNLNEMYDDNTNTWVIKKEMITSRGSLASSTLNDKIYVIGGYNGNNLNINEAYSSGIENIIIITKKPTINYTGNNVLSFEVKSNISLPNITAKDDAGFVEPTIEIRKNNQTVSEISNLTLGSYTVRYDFTNKIGTATIYLTVNIVDTKAPVFEYSGSNIFIVKYKEKFELPNVTAKDDYDGIITATKIIKYNNTVVNEINTSISGDYTVIYTAKDSSNNKSTLELKVTVEDVPEGWGIVKDAPTSRCNLTSSTLNGKIYVIGGWDNDGTLDTNEMYNDITNTWTTKQKMSSKRKYLTSSTLNDKIYAIGGYIDFSKNEQYDDTTNTWTAKREMSTERHSLTSSTLNGKIYAIGGQMSSESAINEMYSDITNTWTIVKEMSIGRSSLTSSTLNGKIYAIGGWGNNNGFYDTNEQYDDKTNTWSTKNQLPYKKSQITSSALNSKMYVIGGVNYNGMDSKDNLMYDSITDTWSYKKTMYYARKGLTSSTLNGKIYVMCGKNVNGKLNKNEVYYPDPSYKTTRSTILPIQENINYIEPKKLGFNYSGERDITITQYSDFKIPLVKYVDEEGEHDTVLSIKYDKTYPISEIITAFYGKYTLQYVYKQKLLTLNLNIVGKEPNVFIQPNEELFIDEIINQPTQSYTGPAPKGDNFYQVREYCLKLREERLKRERGDV